ncbi:MULTISPECIES: GntR family transcriptional regulator [unclassified Sphingomonas]|jgi:DNA-binding FadR family transcriptional regulator|uniref:GntR family transcriptional regulator n=1 Tax=unclassified Sphingomonas TaxID=196159 RepID=UPI002150CCB7|nr:MULTISPECIES: GntR family transcriptional regulator [unclassified Sphingomonas]MCR5870887.1 GntR family transcriptional regulator [Sphingomonas sp. J344]UUY00793.1 GntR family transcriptional regulator [Sphingomonas sp. J315]
MSKRQASFSRVYTSTKSQLRSAKLAPGTQLLVNEWASLHGVSATPVREALAKLAGETLVEDRERLGYFVPLLSSIEVAGLYELLELYLVRAVVHWKRNSRDNSSGLLVTDSDEGDTAILVLIARRSNNPLLIEEAQRCLDRLAFARRQEAEIFGPSEQVAKLVEVCTRGNTEKLAGTVRSYCHAGRNRADAVAHAMAAGYRETIARK